MRTILALFILISIAGCKSTSRLEAVSDFELKSYLGTWYEAARYPHRFENNLSSVSAEYSLNSDGTVKVLNRGFNDKTKEWENIEGVAKIKRSPDLGWLKVSFFKPFYASYKIIHLSDDYSQAIVTGPTYGYLWILVRDPDLASDELQKLINQAEQFGFNTSKILRIDQSRNIK